MRDRWKGCLEDDGRLDKLGCETRPTQCRRNSCWEDEVVMCMAHGERHRLNFLGLLLRPRQALTHSIDVVSI